MVRLDALSGWAVLCGLGLGLGLWSLASLVPRLSRPRLTARVAPYVVDVSAGARELLGRRTVDPLPVVGALFGPAFERLRTLLGSALGGGATIELRLRQSSSPLTVEAFRSRQLAWGIGAALLGLVAPLAFARVRPIAPALVGAIVVISAISGIVLCDRMLHRAAVKRLARITAELPTVLEFLTLSLSAGEGILDALRRVGRVSRGELAAELAAVVTVVNTGVPLAESLDALASGIRLPALTRCVDQVTGALERGTPLAEVLRAQAQDARDDAKRELLEVAGRKEVAMLVPLVFLILPVTIVFAIYPGIFVLQFGL
ncbi:type II secretion system F family protein [Lacisediminihabitans sp. H27-G8]|uniref:type II secretion system F family protein n=1 Tax=Lacisediminihabitans sp. H27-G8 TaxID=3111909 RepID=UPI0038FC1E3C